MREIHDYRKEVMIDCIHLKACRRVQKIAKSKGAKIPRYCMEECSCYQSFVDIVGTQLNELLDELDTQVIRFNPLDAGGEYGRGMKHGASKVIDAITKEINKRAGD